MQIFIGLYYSVKYSNDSCTEYGLRGTMPPSPSLSLSLQAYCVFRVVVGGLVVTWPHHCAAVAVSNAATAVGIAATGNDGRRTMVMGGRRRAIGDGRLAAADGDGSCVCCR